jgi:hypothetical protein
MGGRKHFKIFAAGGSGAARQGSDRAAFPATAQPGLLFYKLLFYKKKNPMKCRCAGVSGRQRGRSGPRRRIYA